jgi:hypothetical protein
MELVKKSYPKNKDEDKADKDEKKNVKLKEDKKSEKGDKKEFKDDEDEGASYDDVKHGKSSGSMAKEALRKIKAKKAKKE